MLTFDDLQVVLGGAEFTVPEKIDAVTAIAGGELQSGEFSLHCLGVEHAGVFQSMEGLEASILDDLAVCFEADLNHDGVVGFADFVIATDRTTPLNVSDRIRFIHAIQSPLCAGGLG
jgi:hypothetical protein